MIKYAYKLADFAKGIKAARAKGLVHRRNLEVAIDHETSKVTMPMTKGHGDGPMGLVMDGKKASGHRQGYDVDLRSHKKGIYSRGSGATELFSGITGHRQNHVTRKSMDGTNRKAFNHVIMRHEMDELRAHKELLKHNKHNLGSSFIGTSHQAPSVLLRESNNVAKLGAGTHGKEIYHKAKGLLTSARRESGEASHLNSMVNSYQAPKRPNTVFKNHKPSHAPMNYEYGKTRLSRHAIRAMDKASIRQSHTLVVPKD